MVSSQPPLISVVFLWILMHIIVMERKIYLDILPQPDDTTCGPTCLHAVYRYYDFNIQLQQVIEEVKSFEEGGTLAVYLGLHALEQGFNATLYSYNLQVFDPTWFSENKRSLRKKLSDQLQYKIDPGFQLASRAYMDFLDRGGLIRFENLSGGLLRRYLKTGKPILTGLSATYLYNCARERVSGKRLLYDDIRGIPTGHFVVLTGYDKEIKSVFIADPLKPNPFSEFDQYAVTMNRLICAIMLGILTYDANLLIIEPKGGA